MPTSQYHIPAYGSGGATLLGWLLEGVQEGQAWLNAQGPTKGWPGVMQMLSAVDGGENLVEHDR